MQNFPDIEQEVLTHKAGIKVADINELKKEIIRLLTDSNYYNDLRYNAKKIFEEENEGLNETLALTKALLEK
jgi:3-deoxy-D-manno-octulosonic-acid transferase